LTRLLAHRAVGTHNLAEMNPADVARIAAALDAVDQAEPAHRFRRDVVAAHLLAAAHAQAIDLPPVTAATSAQDQSAESLASSTGDGSDAGSVTETTGDLSGTAVGQDGDAAGALTPASGTAPATAQQTPATAQQINDNNL
jgi:hypothetical protein